MQVGGNLSEGGWKHSRKPWNKKRAYKKKHFSKKNSTTSSKTVSAVPVVQADEAVE